jgi:hypothetical protein
MRIRWEAEFTLGYSDRHVLRIEFSTEEHPFDTAWRIFRELKPGWAGCVGLASYTGVRWPDP